MVLRPGHRASAEQFGPAQLFLCAAPVEQRCFAPVVIPCHVPPDRHDGGRCAETELPRLRELT
jgi:hypothetical protein